MCRIAFIVDGETGLREFDDRDRRRRAGVHDERARKRSGNERLSDVGIGSRDEDPRRPTRERFAQNARPAYIWSRVRRAPSISTYSVISSGTNSF